MTNGILDFNNLPTKQGRLFEEDEDKRKRFNEFLNELSKAMFPDDLSMEAEKINKA